jgi:hypothetical protein
MSRKSLFMRKKGATANIYANADVVYSLQRFYPNWDNKVLYVRRSSDDAVRHVWFNDSGEIGLDSLISETADNPPTGGTLGDFIGSNDCYVYSLGGQTPDLIFDTDKSIFTAVRINSSQPLIIEGGVLLTKNNKTTLKFLNDATFYKTNGALPVLASGNTFTILTVSYSESTADSQSFLCTSLSSVNRFVMFNDRRSNKQHSIINGASSITSLLNSQQNNNNQRILTNVVTPSQFKSYFNGTLQDTKSWSGTYVNDTLRLGAQFSGATPLDGGIQAVVIFPSDKTADLTTLHDDINSKYAIY